MCHVKCTICEKKIHAYKYNLDEYVYKIGNKYFCSWKHQREYEKKTEKPKIKHMKWERESSTTAMAVGEFGTFRITRQGGMYWGRYHGKDNRHFKLPPRRLISQAKELCRENYFWEE